MTDMNVKGAWAAYASGEAAAAPALREACPFRVGAAVSRFHLTDGPMKALIRRQISSITCENDMKPESLLDRAATLAQGEADRAAFRLDRAAPYLDFAQENGVGVRMHTLAWHNQTPRWFFTEGYSDAPDAPTVDAATMEKRQRAYIAEVMEKINERWPGVVYAWDVVNEAIEPDNGHERGFRMRKSMWYQVMGERFVEVAFDEARRHVRPGQKLFYNDYLSFLPEKRALIQGMLRGLCERGLVDGMGMQMHIHPDLPETAVFEEAVREYAALGLTIELTEMDVNGAHADAASQQMLARRYYEVGESIRRLQGEGIDIDSVTVWGLTDDHCWLTRPDSHVYPMLFDAMCAPKAAAFALMGDASVLDTPCPDGPARSPKAMDEHNPVMAQAFGADPWALVWNGRVYLYMTGDHPCYDDKGRMTPNHYGEIDTIHVASSDDLVNWVDHGEIRAAGPMGAARWARNSWAPAAACKRIGDKDRFFLYFADSGNGIGVLSADSPTGPFADPIGGPLVSRRTPTCDRVTWLFDPAVLVDEDGTGWLYCGGGVPQGRAEDPGTARIIRLGDDMVSLAQSPIELAPPFLFEDSGINRFGSKYVYSYCSNFNAHDYPDNALGITDGEIQTMVADSPAGPFVYRGAVLHNPGAYFGRGGNNHHCMFSFGGAWYMAYHAQALEMRMQTAGGYRSTHIDRLALDASGLPVMSEGTMAGVGQLKSVDPYSAHPGAFGANMAGVGLMDMGGEQAAASLIPGAWIKVCGADFGAGAMGAVLRFRGQSACTVRVHLDSLDTAPAAEMALPCAHAWRELLCAFDAPIKGVHDVFFVFSEGGELLSQWRFCAEREVVTGPNPITGMDFPDMDVIRVEDTYYMVSTTMHMMPGCVILSSHDLIRWEYCTRVYDVLEDTPRQNLEEGGAYGAGMWAASLRYHKGEFFVAFVANDTHKTYLFRARDIHGPWQRSEIEGFYHDCSLFFDEDDRVFLAHGNRRVRLTELKADLTGPKAGGMDRVIADYGEGGCLGYEGSHLYKIGGRYYLFVIHSLKDRWRRVESCFSADSIEGEFRGGVVFDDDLGLRADGIAQGGVVDTPDGRWFALLFQDTGALGRVPVLIPMAWEFGRPVIGLNGKAPRVAANLTTRPGEQVAPLFGSDDFSGPLHPAWEWNHIPVRSLTGLSGGALTITTGKAVHALTQARNTLTQRAVLPACAAEVTLDASALRPGDTAGLCALQSRYGLIGLTRGEKGFRLIVRTREEGDAEEGVERASMPWEGAQVRLRAQMRFSAERDEVRFFFEKDGAWQALGEAHPLAFTLDHFMGARFGLFAMSACEAGGTASFTRFEYTRLEA